MTGLSHYCALVAKTTQKLRPRSSRLLSEEQIKQAHAWARQSVTNIEIGKRLGVHENTAQALVAATRQEARRDKA